MTPVHIFGLSKTTVGKMDLVNIVMQLYTKSKEHHCGKSPFSMAAI